ncbi:protein DEK-like [Uloborus diversus]|uniref:protein DEK-like n=1 Tax=Uloborus diversus TaxID=327109 RepID=UPI0024092A03|nr:protein DEK-like [Uloborus diversus]
MILYLTTSAQNNIRKNILEFSGFPFDESSSDYHCRRGLMEQLSIEDLKAVATVLCVSQYIVDESRNSLIDAILKFLLKPSALLNSSTIMPTISPVPVPRLPVKKKATSTTCKVSQSSSSEVVVSDLPSGIVISKVESVAPKPFVNHCSMGIKKEDHKPELKKLQACFSSSDIEIVPIPLHRESSRRESPCSSIEIVPLPIKKEKRKVSKEDSCVKDSPICPTSELHATKKENESFPSTSTPMSFHIKSEPCEHSSPQESPSLPKRSPAEADENQTDFKNLTAARVVQYLGSDEDDDQPLSKMIGHPNDDQLRALVIKIMKESKLEDVTMKHVICRVFETYPNYDLGYRKEFIKSIVRQILSQMDNPNCSVSTTVINI